MGMFNPRGGPLQPSMMSIGTRVTVPHVAGPKEPWFRWQTGTLDRQLRGPKRVVVLPNGRRERALKISIRPELATSSSQNTFTAAEWMWQPIDTSTPVGCFCAAMRHARSAVY